jgi:hypothetical protein
LVKNQGVMALTTLSIAGIEILRNTAIRALTNHMAFNPQLAKTFVSKSELLKLAKQIDNVRVRVPLIINTKAQKFLRVNNFDLSLFAYDSPELTTQGMGESKRCDIIWIVVEDI